MSGSESVKVGSVGTMVELTGSGEIVSTHFVWRSADSPDEFENLVPMIPDVEELIVRSGVAGGARAVSSGGVQVSMDLRSGAEQGDLGERGAPASARARTSMDGLHIAFNKQ